MLVCSVVLRPERGAIASAIVESADAFDNPTVGIALATLIDAAATAVDYLDAFNGSRLVEAASADATVNAAKVQPSFVVEEISAAVATQNASISVVVGISAGVSEAATADTVQDAGISGPASDFLARTSGLDTTHVNAYTALINGLVADGLWSKFDVLYVFATQDSTTAKLNLVSTNYTAVANGSPTFTADRGFNGVDGSSTVYLNTGFNASTATSPKYTQNSAHISSWDLTNSHALNNQTVGTYNGTQHAYLLPHYNDNRSYMRINMVSNLGIAEAVSVSDTRGLWLGCRESSTRVVGYQNGGFVANNNATGSAAVNNLNVYVLSMNNSGTVAGCSAQLASVSLGSTFNSTEASNFYTRLRTYMTAVGVP